MYNAPRTGGGSGWYVNYRSYIWRSAQADAVSAGWQLQYESAVRADSRPLGFLAHNGSRCLLLRQRWEGAPDASCYQETSANWGSVTDTGIPGKRFRAVWWHGAWWLTYGQGGSYYMANGLFWRRGGSSDSPAWQAEQLLAPGGTNYQLVLPYGDGSFISAVYAAGRQFWHADIPDDESEDFPRAYAGSFPTAYFPMGVEARGLAGEENPLLLREGSRIWAARMVEE